MRFISLLAAASVALPILASPVAAPEPPTTTKAPTRSEYMKVEQRASPFCILDELFLIFLNKQYASSASTFCSSYIAKTTTLTSSTTLTAVTSTTASAVLATVTSTLLTTTTNTIHTDTTTVATDTIYQKRAAPTIPIPTFASKYAASLLSSACSCLITPSTMSKTTTTTGKPVTLTVITTVPLITTTSTSATVTQTTDIPLQATATQTLSFCAYQALVAKSDHAILDVDCGTSYDNIAGGYYETVSIANDCFNICDADQTCGAFTFEPGVTSNNCYIVHVNEGHSEVVDANAESGCFTGQFAS